MTQTQTCANAPPPPAHFPVELSATVRLERLYALDLTNVKRKLREPHPEGKGWTAEQCDQAELWYRRYLHSIIVEPSKTHVPNGPIDAFWHQHILDTKAYREDCRFVLGYFLDHWPYFGLNGDADQRDESFDETNAIYVRLFGEDCRQMSAFTFGKPEEVPTCGSDGGGCHGSASKLTMSCGGQGEAEPHSFGAKCTHSGSGTGCGQNVKLSGSGCNSAGSGTGCSQKVATTSASCGGEAVGGPASRSASCNHSGSGTGCGQGCRRMYESFETWPPIPTRYMDGFRHSIWGSMPPS